MQVIILSLLFGAICFLLGSYLGWVTAENKNLRDIIDCEDRQEEFEGRIIAIEEHFDELEGVREELEGQFSEQD